MALALGDFALAQPSTLGIDGIVNCYVARLHASLTLDPLPKFHELLDAIPAGPESRHLVDVGAPCPWWTELLTEVKFELDTDTRLVQSVKMWVADSVSPPPLGRSHTAVLNFS